MDEVQAARVYDRVSYLLYGEDAITNFGIASAAADRSPLPSTMLQLKGRYDKWRAQQNASAQATDPLGLMNLLRKPAAAHSPGNLSSSGNSNFGATNGYLPGSPQQQQLAHAANLAPGSSPSQLLPSGSFPLPFCTTGSPELLQTRSPSASNASQVLIPMGPAAMGLLGSPINQQQIQQDLAASATSGMGFLNQQQAVPSAAAASARGVHQMLMQQQPPALFQQQQEASYLHSNFMAQHATGASPLAASMPLACNTAPVAGTASDMEHHLHLQLAMLQLQHQQQKQDHSPAASSLSNFSSAANLLELSASSSPCRAIEHGAVDGCLHWAMEPAASQSDCQFMLQQQQQLAGGLLGQLQMKGPFVGGLGLEALLA